MPPAPESAIVVDVGGYALKYGLSANVGDPPSTVPTLVGVDAEGMPYIGGHLEGARRKGIIEDVINPAPRGWSDTDEVTEKLIAYCYEQLERVTYDHPIMLTVPPGIPRDAMETTIQMLFERFNAPAAYLLPAPVAALHATGKHEGVVVDVGEAGTHAAPVRHGAVVRHALRTSPTGGAALTDYFAGVLAGCVPAARMADVTRQHAVALKESVMRVSSSYNHALEGLCPYTDIPGRQGVGTTTTLAMPDGSEVSVAVGKERLLAGEVLFRPAYPPHGQGDVMGVQDLLMSALEGLPVAAAHELAQAVVVCGGTSLADGFSDRLQGEVECAAPMHLKPRLLFPRDRGTLVWRGAALTASLPQFTDSDVWVTKQEYNEEGPTVVH